MFSFLVSDIASTCLAAGRLATCFDKNSTNFTSENKEKFGQNI
jgi:hypothetical protein